MDGGLWVHGLEWTTKELFVYPNEYIYWSLQIVMYPFMTGLVAGAFVLSSLYHLFGQKDLEQLAKFSLLFSFALLPVAVLPLAFHLQHPFRGIHAMLTPHFTSAIAAFGIVFTGYFMIVASEIWFVYREFFVAQTIALKNRYGLVNTFKRTLYRILTLGAYDISEEALAADRKAVKVLAGIGIPAACFLHGYAGFIFGSVKANALWMSPLMPVIFIMSAVVSGIALCMMTYIGIMEWKKLKAVRARGRGDYSEAISGVEDGFISEKVIGGVEIGVIRKASRYLLGFMVAAISLELLDLVFRGYTAVKSWDILRSVMYDKDYVNIFVLQYGIGNLLPFILLLIPRLTLKRAVSALTLILFGVLMMRWNVVIGGQAFSLSFSGFMDYHMPIIPYNLETFKEGLLGGVTVMVSPFIIFWVINKFIPSLEYKFKA